MGMAVGSTFENLKEEGLDRIELGSVNKDRKYLKKWQIRNIWLLFFVQYIDIMNEAVR